MANKAYWQVVVFGWGRAFLCGSEHQARTWAEAKADWEGTDYDMFETRIENVPLEDVIYLGKKIR